MNRETLKEIIGSIRDVMDSNMELLTQMDARAGDGDLGVSMRDAFREAYLAIDGATEDLGQILMRCAMAVNAAAPSTAGTILSFWMMGTSRALKNKSEASLEDVAAALEQGIQLICEKAKSKPGEKTILDAIVPAVEALRAHAGDRAEDAASAAFMAASAGAESTKDMLPKHGRAAYYGERMLGVMDGGAVAGKLIFDGACRYFQQKQS